MAVESPEADELTYAVQEVFNKPAGSVRTFTYGPGRAPRQTRRVYFGAESIIATRRTDPRVASREVEILQRLRGGGVAVPRVLGRFGTWFFQEDLGPVTLSQSLNLVKPPDNAIENALEELRRIWVVGSARGLDRIVPALEGSKWAVALASELLEIASGLGPNRGHFTNAFLNSFCEALAPTGGTFIRWDARPPNAVCGQGERVWWFDFEHSVCHWALDDLVWFFCDETIPDDVDSVTLLERACADVTRECSSLLPPAALDYAGCLALFHCCWRLSKVTSKEYAGLSTGWEDCVINDWPGSFVSALRLCDRGARMSYLSAITRPFESVFKDLGERFRELESRSVGTR